MADLVTKNVKCDGCGELFETTEVVGQDTAEFGEFCSPDCEHEFLEDEPDTEPISTMDAEIFEDIFNAFSGPSSGYRY